MSKIETFEDLKVWQKARALAKEIYDLSNAGSFSKDFALRDQINRAAGSVMDNIAEGFERGGNKEFSQFLSFSKGSCGEIRSQIIRAFDHGHINKDELIALKNKSIEISKQITGFMKYLKNSELKGFKYNIEESLENYDADIRS